jgi:hypothetical protein
MHVLPIDGVKEIATVCNVLPSWEAFFFVPVGLSGWKSDNTIHF